MSSGRAKAAKTLCVVGLALLMVWSTVSIFSAAAPEETGVYIVSLDEDTSPEVFRMNGMKVLVDYGNGFYLTQATESQALSMQRSDVEIVHMKNIRVLDLYPSDVVFDTSRGVPSAPPAMRGFQWDGEAYIVQFVGPYRSDWLETVEGMGATVGKLVPIFSAVIKMSPEVRSRMSELPYVHWIGEYKPWYKISSELLSTEGGIRVTVMTYEDSYRNVLARKLTELGASVLSTHSPSTVVAYLDSKLLPWVASMPDVMHIQRDYTPMPIDIVADKIHGAFDSWYPTRSGLPSSLTGQSPGPDGIEDTADDIFEVVGIQDSGFDMGNPDAGHPDFFMGPHGDRVKRYVDRTDYSDPDGFMTGTAHGTHVAGIVVGNGFAWEYQYGYPTDDDDWEHAEGVGVAPEAYLSIDGVQNFGQGLLARPEYWDDQYNLDGAHVNSNSYGTSPSDYGGDAVYVDQRIDIDNNRLIVFAASNEGPDLNTLSSNTQGKNGLSAGASLNFRPEWFEADNPNLIADFSSRGGPLQSYGRLKPDMVTVGTASIGPMGVGEWLHNDVSGIGNPQPSCIMEVDVYNYNNPTALDGDGICDYRYMGGTSVASPHMAGLVLLVREYLREIGGIDDPYQINSQLVKALMINGAVRMDPALYEYPGYDQGWGRVDLIQSLFPPVPRTNRWEEGIIGMPGQTWTPTFETSVQSDEVPFKVTLVWVDTWGKSLNRDLNLLVTSPSGDQYKGNVYGTVGPYDGWSVPNPSIGDANALWDRVGPDGWDDVNNVEQVEVEFPETGTWSIEVIGFSVPSAVPFALVAAADFGPQTEFKIDIDTDSTLSLEATQNGEVFFPFWVTNFGTSADNVYLDSVKPPGITVNFDTPVIFGLESRDTFYTYATISVGSTVPGGIYDLKITAQSLSDPNVKDQLEFTLSVPSDVVVTPIRITSETVDELDPSVLTFNDGVNDHIFIAYRKTTAVSADGKKGGVNVWVAHTTLDSKGFPILPFNHTEVSDWNDDPNDLRWTYIPPGPYNHSNRVILTWTGDDPEAVDKDLDSYGVSSYSDPPYTTWNRRVIERNVGSSLMNEARVNIPIWRDDGTPDGEVIWVWEHLDFTNPEANNPIRVQTWVTVSRDSGESWPSCPSTECRRISPFDNNYYFFPNACLDTQSPQTLWVFFYYRLPAGNDRDLMVRVYDEDGWQGDSTPMDSKDDVSLLWNTLNTNLQWPACVAANVGGKNRVYVVVTNDEGAVDLKLYLSYLQGEYGALNRPFGLNTTEESGISPNLYGPYGPMGGSVSNSNYDRRPILNMEHTDDGWAWIAYIENANEFNAPNLWTYSSTDADGYATIRDESVLTANTYAKGHQMTDSLTVNGYYNIYEVYHASKGTETEVNYDVYLLIYHKGWENDPDTVGPVVDPVVASPNPFDVSIEGKELKLYATISDITTGMSNIKAAQWKEVPLSVTDPSMIDWTTNVSSMVIGTDSPTETGLAILLPSDWDGGETHRLCARGQDAQDNWGLGACVDVTTIGKKPIYAVFDLTITSTGWVLISIPLSLSDNSIDAVFQNITGKFDELRVYDAAAGKWLSYNTNKQWQSLNSVDKTMGVWIHMTQAPATIHVEGNLTYVTEISLQPGWNLIGYPSLNTTGISVGDLLTDPFIETVEGYDGANTPFLLRELDPSYYLQPGEGYWVYFSSDRERKIPIPGGY